MSNDDNLKVRVRNPEGTYLAGNSKTLRFTDDPLKALVLDYHRHKVTAQLESLKRTIGMVLEAEPIDYTQDLECWIRARSMDCLIHRLL
jgi:hypothetical protein